MFIGPEEPFSSARQSTVCPSSFGVVHILHDIVQVCPSSFGVVHILHDIVQPVAHKLPKQLQVRIILVIVTYKRSNFVCSWLLRECGSSLLGTNSPASDNIPRITLLVHTRPKQAIDRAVAECFVPTRI